MTIERTVSAHYRALKESSAVLKRQKIKRPGQVFCSERYCFFSHAFVFCREWYCFFSHAFAIQNKVIEFCHLASNTTNKRGRLQINMHLHVGNSYPHRGPHLSMSLCNTIHMLTLHPPLKYLFSMLEFHLTVQPTKHMATVTCGRIFFLTMHSTHFS